MSRYLMNAAVIPHGCTGTLGTENETCKISAIGHKTLILINL
jgi:hypothetical protein